MNSFAHGLDTLSIEVTNISAHGFWLWIGSEELFLPFESFPWFRQQPIEAILNVERISPDHFHWPDIDIDLTIEMIENPDRFPLSAK